jgi:hypothetical protein
VVVTRRMARGRTVRERAGELPLPSPARPPCPGRHGATGGCGLPSNPGARARRPALPPEAHPAPPGPRPTGLSRRPRRACRSPRPWPCAGGRRRTRRASRRSRSPDRRRVLDRGRADQVDDPVSLAIPAAPPAPGRDSGCLRARRRRAPRARSCCAQAARQDPPRRRDKRRLVAGPGWPSPRPRACRSRAGPGRCPTAVTTRVNAHDPLPLTFAQARRMSSSETVCRWSAATTTSDVPR